MIYLEIDLILSLGRIKLSLKIMNKPRSVGENTSRFTSSNKDKEVCTAPWQKICTKRIKRKLNRSKMHRIRKDSCKMILSSFDLSFVKEIITAHI